uniref:NADH-ubiquinone oxidoreductase chain 4L n=1 Tax=Trigonopterus triradiatus TaxID=2678947 RepID=A0A7H1KHX5_9CUCU|nr:NADH dehydrogenase subunit 4L [Trigonopterus triradiatus]QNT26891.1 NADH dehydrogenase subunit 4L [Trigonopterus triradiatus]
MSMFFFSLYFFFVFMSGLYIYLSKYKHFLVMLLSLEVVVLSLYGSMLMYFSMYVYEYFMLMFFLTLSVCESVLGLSMLVLIVRSHGSDVVMMFDSLW